MGYLAYLISLIILVTGDTKGLSFQQGLDKLLDIATGVNAVMFWIILAIWIVGLVIFVWLKVTERINRYDVLRRYENFGCGCFVFFIAALPVIQFIVWRLSIGLAEAWGQEGATDPVKFWALVALSVLLGSG